MMKRGEKNHYLEGLHQQIQEQSPNVAAMIAGSVTFGSTLSMSTFLQKHLLRISTGTWPRMIPSTVGFVTVCLASWLSHRASLEAQHALSSYYYARQQQQHRLLLLPWRDTTAPLTRRYYPNNEEQGTTLSIRNSWINDEVTLPFTKRQISVCVIGVVAFKAMGGRFLSIAPSSYTSPGSFARLSTPAKSTSYATANERDAVRKIGKRYGCHTCGTRKPFYRGSDAFVADHMPPNAIVESLKKPTKQDFYPQCKACSGIQGGLLSTVAGGSARKQRCIGGGKNSLFHGFRYRNAFVLPGCVIAAASSSLVACTQQPQ